MEEVLISLQESKKEMQDALENMTSDLEKEKAEYNNLADQINTLKNKSNMNVSNPLFLLVPLYFITALYSYLQIS